MKLTDERGVSPYPDREQVGEAAEGCTPECGEPPAETAGVRNKIAAALHYPDHWDTAAYPTLDHAAWESIATAKLTCSECGERQGAAQDCGCEYGKPQCPKNCKLIATLAASAPTLGEADLTHKPPTWTVAEWNVGKWLSAALEDDSVCDEMKHDVRAWFDELNACLVQSRAAESKGLTDEQIEEIWQSLSTHGINYIYGDPAKELRVRFARALLSKGE